MRFATKAIHVGEEPLFGEGHSGDVIIPIHLSTTFARLEVEKPTGGYEYSRTANPTRSALEKRLASLENGKYGLAFSSGLAAEASVLLALLNSGDHIVAFNDLYGGTIRLFNKVLKNFNIEVTYVDAQNPINVKNAIKKNTKILWMETPTNPLLRLCDIKIISQISKEHNLITVIDNTFMTPYFQRPLELGADIVVHSTTKYLNGHSDSIGGAIITSNDTLYEKIKFIQNAVGAILSPFDSYLVLRGLKTLHVRMKEHEANALKLAQYLEQSNKVERVFYPGLPSHPQHQLAKSQMFGFGGMLSFTIKGTKHQAKKFVENIKIFSLAESLGGVESLIEIPSLMTHSAVTEYGIQTNIPENLIRVSVGIEDINDLIDAFDDAFKKI